MSMDLEPFNWPISPRFLSIREGVKKYDIQEDSLTGDETEEDKAYSPNRDGLF